MYEREQEEINKGFTKHEGFADRTQKRQEVQV